MTQEEDRCPECGAGRGAVEKTVRDRPFQYGAESPVQLVAKDVPGWTCSACGLEWTGRGSEEAHDRAVQEHLLAAARNPGGTRAVRE